MFIHLPIDGVVFNFILKLFAESIHGGNNPTDGLIPTSAYCLMFIIHFLLLYFIHQHVPEIAFSVSNLVEKLKQEALSCIVRPSRFKLLGLNCTILVEDTWAY